MHPSRLAHQRKAPHDRDVPVGETGETGTGLIGSAAGVAVFLIFLLFAVQLTVNLYATSTVTAAGFDAARTVASRRVDHHDATSVATAQVQAEEVLRSLLGETGRQADLTWTIDAEVVRLELVVDAPGILPSALAGGMGLRHIERTFVVRIEQSR